MTRLRLRINIPLYIFLTVSMLGLLIFPADTIKAAKDGISICQSVIIPSLFPFFVFSSIALSVGMFDDTAFLFSALMKIFRLRGPCAPAFLIGIVAGFPVGAKTAVSLYENGSCTRRESECLLAFCNNCGPAFIFGTVGAGLWGNMNIGIMLYIVQIISAILTGIVFGIFWRSTNKYIKSIPQNKKRLPLFKAFVASVKGSAVNVFYVCAFILFFSVCLKLLYLLNIVPLISNAISAITGLDRNAFNGIISGFFEITNGVNEVSASTDIPANVRLILTGIILGWSGLSVHCQTLLFLQSSGLSSKPYFLGKALQSLISGFLTFAALLIVPFDISAFSPVPKWRIFSVSGGLSVFLISVLIVLMLTILIFYIRVKGITEKHSKKL